MASTFSLRSVTAIFCGLGIHSKLILRRRNLWHILLYMPSWREDRMQRTAKIFMNNRSQAVRLPKEFQFTTSEVFIRRDGDDVILSARPKDWSAYLASGPVASDEFL